MIKVIVERRAKEPDKVSALLRELRAAAVHWPGYITGETLASTEDSSAIATISTWRSVDDWKKWEASKTRNEVSRKIETLLMGKAVVKTYQVMATEAAT